MRRKRSGKEVEAEAEAVARGKLDEAVGVAIGPGRGGEQGVVEWFWSSWRRPRPATAGEGRHMVRTLLGLWFEYFGPGLFRVQLGPNVLIRMFVRRIFCENSSSVVVKLIKIYKERDQLISACIHYITSTTALVLV